MVLSKPNLENIAHINTCKPTSDVFNGIPVVDLSEFNYNNAKNLIVEACKEFGFFKVINHGVSMELSSDLEAETIKFFELSQQEKEKLGPPSPFGYGNKKIGPNGDVGWVEYLLFCTNPQLISHDASFTRISQTLRNIVNKYICKVRNMVCQVLEMIVDEMQIGPRDVLSRLIRDEKSDSRFRLNHYPPCHDRNHVIGFGEHTDPQILSVIRSNTTSGLQICLRDRTWVDVPPDPTSFFFNVGDALQVLTNGRFMSVKHRVLADSLRSRVSMIYFAGPPLSEKITPLASLMEDGEESLYREFTWSEYRKSAYKTRLSDNRLGFFQKFRQIH